MVLYLSCTVCVSTYVVCFVGIVGYGVGVASVAMVTGGMQSVLHTRLCSTLGPHSQTEGVKWEHVCADQCAGCRW